ncbi:MAG: hypothetical protein ACYCPE_10790 [Metallibacterium sp.]
MSQQTALSENSALLEFTTIDASVVVHAAKQDQRLPWIKLTAALKYPQTIFYKQSSRAAADIKWTIQIYQTEDYNDHASEMGAIGNLAYYEFREASDPREEDSPEQGVICAAIGPTTFAALLTAANQGKKPGVIMVTVNGISVGRDHMAIFDSESAKWLPVIDLEIVVLLAS